MDNPGPFPKRGARAGRFALAAKSDNTGIVSETTGAEMGAKGVIFGGFGREKGGQKGVFWAPEAGKKALFCVPEG